MSVLSLKQVWKSNLPLAPQKGVATTVIVGRDDTGKIHAKRAQKRDPLVRSHFDDDEI